MLNVIRCAAALLFLAAAAWPSAVLGEAAAREKRPPNVLFILIDDLGWADLGCYGNKFHETPQIDGLAKQGMLFTDAYAASPVCSSTRCSLMTGKYSATVGITDFIPGHWRPWEKLVVPPIKHELPLEEVTLAEPLKAKGYATCYLGKWHLGGASHYPDKQGFDRTIVAGGGRHFGNALSGDVNMKLPQDEHLTDYLTDQALDFIDAHREQPFFVYLSHYAVHIPLEAKQTTIKKYEAKAKRMNEKQIAPKSHPTYAAMLENVDENVGRLLAKLDEWELADNTIVIFFSDNGGLIQRFDKAGPKVAPQDPLRDEKGTVYEGGIRVPMLVRWPGVVEPGSRCDEPVTSADFFPTLVEFAEAGPHARHEVDGKSLRPLLTQQGAFERDAIYFHYPHYHHMDPAGAIRAGDLKLVEHFDDGQLELFNLRNDLSESNDLAAEMPQQAKKLQQQLAAWRKRVGARMPTPNPDYDPAKAPQWGKRRR
ncbi:MAG: sulfatase [Pirellulaceae bacterium]